jgi:EmrB/QacA subfamily drug resistance transporter
MLTHDDTDRSRWLALYVLCTGMLMIVLDATVVNVALPSIQDDLGFSSSSLAWVVNAYLIAFAGLLLLAGRLGDLVGRRRVLLAGLALFTGASLLCGAAQNQQVLIAARFVQGIGGALASAVILGMIVTMFPEPNERAKALGVYGFVASAGGSIGLIAGGVLTQSLNWHWIFLINIPIGIVTAILAVRLVPDDAGSGLREGADLPGAILITAALMLAVYTVVEPASKEGWAAGKTLLLGALAFVLLLAFVVRQATARRPIMPLRIFRSRMTVGANAVQMLTVAGMFGMFFLGSLYLQRILGYGALSIGLAFLPTTLVMGTLSLRFAGPVMMRFGARKPLVGGLLLIVAALALFTQAPVHGNYFEHVLPVMLLLGCGVGICFPALMTLAMSDTAPADAGLASGLANTTAQAGAALGLAVLATFSSSHAASALRSGSSQPAALTSGYHLAFVIAAALVLAAVAIALVVIKPSPVSGDVFVDVAELESAQLEVPCESMTLWAQGQANAQDGAARFRVDRDCAAVPLFDDAPGDIETEPRAFADVLRRIEGFECSGRNLRRHPVAGVGDLDDEVRLVGTGREPQRAAAWHCIDGVVDEVRPDLIELTWVSDDARHAVVVVANHRDSRAQLVAEHDQRALETVGDVEFLHRGAVELRVRLHRSDQLGDPSR